MYENHLSVGNKRGIHVRGLLCGKVSQSKPPVVMVNPKAVTVLTLFIFVNQ